jgi:antitoxin component YwqK of YwqJK toxin-antitoxin module
MIWLLVDDDNDSFTGWVKESYSSQSLQKLGYLKKGQKQGLWLSWHENGNIASKIEWEEDRLSGLYKHWYKNGNLHAFGQTIDGEMDGEWLEYYSNSQLQAHSLNQMGKCVWKKIWRKNGEICVDSKLENGNGFFYEYYENGDNPKKKIFQNGVEIKFSPD